MGSSASKNSSDNTNKKTESKPTQNGSTKENDSVKKYNSKFSSVFPTPDSLAAAQVEYTKANAKKKQNNGSNGETPEPFPPPTTKAEVYKEANYKNIDEHARKAPMQLAAKSYAALASYLVKPTKNEIGKVRSFYVWIASQTVQKVIDYVGTKPPSPETPLYTVLLTLVKQWGNGYSELFSKLCEEEKIPCRIVRGFVKGSGYRLGERVTTKNDYCIVYVDKAWRFVDPHWGSQFVISTVDNNKDWEIIADETQAHSAENRMNNNENEANNLEMGNHCDDFYFLTDPVAMVYTHLTCEPHLQLLARPVTESEFAEMAYLKDSFFELGMTTVSHPKCLVDSNDDGTVLFEFGLDKSRRCQFTTELYKSVHDPALNVVDGGFTLDQFVTLENLGDKLRVRIELPRIGRYKFELNGKEIDSEEGFRDVCEYAIECKKPSFHHEPNPENSRGEWGPGADTAKYGLLPVNHDGGIIIAKDGKAQIRLHSNGSKKLLFKPTLKSFESPHEDLRDSICHYQTLNNDIVFLMKLPHQGKYTLQLFAKDLDKAEGNRSAKRGAKTDRSDKKNGKSKTNKGKAKDKKGLSTARDYDEDDDDDVDPSYENICNYLIKSDCGFFDLAPYPPLDNEYKQTGDLTPWVNLDRQKKTSDPRLIPKSHPEAVIDPFGEGQLTVNLTADRDCQLKTRMTRYYQNDGEEEDCSEYVYLMRLNFDFFAFLQFPKVGFYKLDFLTTGKEARIVHQYLINVVDPDTKCSPFPAPGPAWRNEIELIQPRTGQLEANKKVPFKVRVPGAGKVRVEWNNGQSSQELVEKKKDSDVWEGTVPTDPKGGGELKIVSDSNNTLFVYKVLSGQELKEVASERQAAVKDADEYRREVDERKVAEKEEAERQQQEAETKAKKAEEDFKKNRVKYEKEEEMIRKKEEEEERKELAAEAVDEMNNEERESVELKSADLVAASKGREAAWEDEEGLSSRKTKTKRSENANENPRKKVKEQDGNQTYRVPDEEHDEGASDRMTPRRRNSNYEDWHIYQEKLTQQMALEKLRESMRCRDHTMLKKAIVDCQVNEKLQKNKEVKNAHKTLQVIEARKDLEAACESKDSSAIRRQVEKIRRAGLTKYLQSEMHEALYLAESLEREPYNRNILDMGKKMMTEIRRYQNPNPVMHRVMQGAFLMLGEDEDTTDSWKQCQRLCNPQGSRGLNRRMFELQPSKIHPELLARSKEIFSDIDISKVQSVGPGAVTFYVWAKHVLEDAEMSHPKGKEPAKPASRERQREILGRLPLNDKKSRIGINKAMVSSQDSSQPRNKQQHDEYYDDDDDDYDDFD